MIVPSKFTVPATPVFEDVDINTLYDMSNATVVGRGGFSQVLAVRHIATGQMRALKVMPCQALKGRAGDMFTHEKEILRRTCHPNVVCLSETIKTTEKMYMSLDLMSEDLFEFILHHKSVSESAARVIIFQLLSAINYLHEQSIVHRDVKPENILINTKRAIPGKIYPYGSMAIASPVQSGTSSSSGTMNSNATVGTNQSSYPGIYNKDSDSKDTDKSGHFSDSYSKHVGSSCNKDHNAGMATDVLADEAATAPTATTAPQSSSASVSSSSSHHQATEQRLGNINAVDLSEVVFEVKLTDFGLAKLVLEWDVRNTPCGTSFYIAPEVLHSIEAQGAKPLCTNQRLVKSIDVWSAGVVLFVLLSGRPPFYGQVQTTEERRALLSRIDRGILFPPQYGWAAVSEEAKDLLQKMMQQRGDQRITAADALRHPFFTQHGFTRPIAGAEQAGAGHSSMLLPSRRRKITQSYLGAQHELLLLQEKNVSAVWPSRRPVNEGAHVQTVGQVTELERGAPSRSAGADTAPSCPRPQAYACTNTGNAGSEVEDDGQHGNANGRDTNTNSNRHNDGKVGAGNSRGTNSATYSGCTTTTCTKTCHCSGNSSTNVHCTLGKRGSIAARQPWPCAPLAVNNAHISHLVHSPPRLPQYHQTRPGHAVHAHPSYTSNRPCGEAFVSYGNATVPRLNASGNGNSNNISNNRAGISSNNNNNNNNSCNSATNVNMHTIVESLPSSVPIPSAFCSNARPLGVMQTSALSPSAATLPASMPVAPSQHCVLLSGQEGQVVVSREEQQFLHDAFDELQQDVMTVDDAYGEESSSGRGGRGVEYSGITIPFKEAPPSRPAVMNNKIKVGPQLLRRK